MKITYLHQYFRTPAMSGGTRSYEMARRMAAEGHEVTLITMTSDGDQAERWRVETIDGVRVHWLKGAYSNHMSHARRLVAFAYFLWHASFRAAGVKADVVLASSTPLTIAIPGAVAAAIQRAPMVFEVRDLWPEVPIAMGALRHPFAIIAARWLERFAYGRSARVIALSQGMAEGVSATGYPPHRISVAPNSADVALFQNEGADVWRAPTPTRDRPIVLYPGTLGAVNGVEYLVRVAGEAAKIAPEVAFLIVGDGRERAAVKAAAREKGVLDRNLFLAPSAPKSAMPDVLRQASLVVSLVIPLPALWHNSANKIFDAMAAGRPFAVNHGGWQAELIENEGCGLVLPPDDAARAAALLADFLGDPGRRSAAEAASARLGREVFSRDRVYRTVIETLRAAIDDQASVASDTTARPAMMRA